MIALLMRLSIRFLAVCSWILIFFIATSYQQLNFFTQDKKTLNILGWPQIIDREFLVEFENKHNVTVHITYCENNEEMLAKLTVGGSHGYDIIMPSNFFINHYVEHTLIQKLDHSKIPWLKKIDPQILNLPFDLNNRYTVPCFWSVYGIGINHKVYKKPLLDKSWKLIFDNLNENYLVGMLEELPQTYSLMGLYLYNKLNNFSLEEKRTILEKLIEQKKMVLAYTDMRVEYLLASGECPLVFSASSDMAKMVKLYPYIDFFVPKEGSFALLDSFAITFECQQKDLVYSFLSYLYDEGVLNQYAEKFEFTSPLKINQLLTTISTIFYFERIYSEKEYEDLWIEVKAA